MSPLIETKNSGAQPDTLNLNNRADGRPQVANKIRQPQNLQLSADQVDQMKRVGDMIEQLRQTALVTDQVVVKGLIDGYERLLSKIFGYRLVRELNEFDLPVLAGAFADIFSESATAKPKLYSYREGVRLMWSDGIIPPSQVEIVIDRYGLLTGIPLTLVDVANKLGRLGPTISRLTNEARNRILINHADGLRSFLLPRQPAST